MRYLELRFLGKRGGGTVGFLNVRVALCLVAVAALGGCSSETKQDSDSPPAFDTLEAGRIRDTVRSKYGMDTLIIAVCGDSIIQHYFSKEGWKKEIDQTKTAIIIDKNGQYDVYGSNSLTGFGSGRDSGAVVEKISLDSGDLILNIHSSNVSVVFVLSEDKKTLITALVKRRLEEFSLPVRGQLRVSQCEG